MSRAELDAMLHDASHELRETEMSGLADAVNAARRILAMGNFSSDVFTAACRSLETDNAS